jgi:hypothetical protein
VTAFLLMFSPCECRSRPADRGWGPQASGVGRGVALCFSLRSASLIALTTTQTSDCRVLMCILTWAHSSRHIRYHVGRWAMVRFTWGEGGQTT